MQSAAKQWSAKNKDTVRRTNSLYQTFWRWHFYGGIIFAPFLILLSISGALYLYQAEIETMIYKDKLVVEQGDQTMLLSEQVDAVKRKFPEAETYLFGYQRKKIVQL